MGEILGIGSFSGNLVAMQTKHLVPFPLAQRLYRSLLDSILLKSPRQVIDNYKAQYLAFNETFLFVFSTLSENPYLSLDSLYKLKDFLSTISKDFKAEILMKKIVEINFSIEDILHGMDPAGRLGKGNIFIMSKPLQSFYSSSTNLLYMNKPWKEEGTAQTSALVKANSNLALESELAKLTFTLPNAPGVPVPQVHPFASQFIESPPVIKNPPKRTNTLRIAENSNVSSLKPPLKEQNDTCRIVIMVKNKQEKTFVAFQGTSVTNLRVVGQFGIEIKSQSKGTATLRIGNSEWPDAGKIGKRIVNENVRETSGSSYEILLDNIEETCGIIEYIVSPGMIEFNNFPMLAIYNIEKNNNEYIVQLRYQVSANWKSSLDEVSFVVELNTTGAVLLDCNFNGELVGNSLIWKAVKLNISQKAILQARVLSKECKVDHTRIQFKSSNANLSQISADFAIQDFPAKVFTKFIAEIVISNN